MLCFSSMIEITPDIALPENEIQEEFIRASGPGGQNVNKASTAVKLRLDVVNSPSLPDDVKTRLIHLAGKRVTEQGVLIIDARRFRTQERNRRDALDRLIELIKKAAEKPKARRRTGPPRVSKKQRLDAKRRQSLTKRLRRPISHIED